MIDVPTARALYDDFEASLSWNFHFWLHRGAFEIELGDLALADNFLHQAKSINQQDVFIDTELAYLWFKKAIARPDNVESEDLVTEAMELLRSVALRRPDRAAHPHHIAARQGLEWAMVGIKDEKKKREFLDTLLTDTRAAWRNQPSEMLGEAVRELQTAVLKVAI